MLTLVLTLVKDPDLLDQPDRLLPAELPVDPVIQNLHEYKKPPEEGEMPFLVNPDKVQAQLEEDNMGGNAWRRRGPLHRAVCTKSSS